MDSFLYPFYVLWLLIFLTMLYEAAARTNDRRLLRFGLPVFRQALALDRQPNLIDHIGSLSTKLNPETAVPPTANRFERWILSSQASTLFLILPTTAQALEFRYGHNGRGRLLLTAERQLSIVGFFTWPSLIIPIILFLLSAVIPYGTLVMSGLCLGYIASLILGQRHLYRHIVKVSRADFSTTENYHDDPSF